MNRHPVETETQWRVTWFPADRPDVVRTGTEVQVRKMAALQAVWNPIIEKREIVVSEWEMVDIDAPPVTCGHFDAASDPSHDCSTWEADREG